MTENTPMNEYKNRTESKGRLNVILAIIVSFLSCLTIPLSSVDTVGIAVAVAASIACAVFLIKVSSRKIFTVIILVGLYSIFGVSGGLPIIALLLACTVGSGAFAWLISKTESPFLAVIPSLAYAIATVITKNWFASLLSLAFVLPAILLAQSYEKLSTRVSALLRVSVGYLTFIALAVVFSVLYFTGEFRVEIIGEVLDGVRDDLVKLLSSMEISLVNGETQMLMSETVAYNYISMLISLLPAMTVTICNLFAYFAQKVQFAIFRHTEGERRFNELRKVFIMSPMSAVVFILSFLVYTITASSGSSATVATVSSNLYLLFLPGLAFMGIKVFTSGKSSLARPGCLSTVISVLFIFLLFFSTSSAIVMAACFGAYSAIEAPIRKYLEKKRN